MTAPTPIAPDTWTIPIPIAPIGMSPPQTNCVVLVDRQDVHLVDAGEDTGEALAALLAGLAELGLAPERVRTVTATHLHRDHLGLAGPLHERYGAEIVLHRLEQQSLDEGTLGPSTDRATLERWGVPTERWAELLEPSATAAALLPAAATVLVEDGERLPIAGRELRVVHTPGHTAGHIAIHEPARGLLLTGDHVLFDQFPGVGLGGRSENALRDYLRSLDRTPVDGVTTTVPGHGRQDRPLAERVAEIGAHHRRRTEEAAAALREVERPAVWEVARRLTWSRGWEGMRGYTLRSALAQVEMHLGLLTG